MAAAPLSHTLSQLLSKHEYYGNNVKMHFQINLAQQQVLLR